MCAGHHDGGTDDGQRQDLDPDSRADRPLHRSLRRLPDVPLGQRAVRRESRAKTFAEALTTVEEYLEMPYRTRRRPQSSPAVRQQLTDEVSDLLARMALRQAWLQIEASAVAGPCSALVATARADAGARMSLAWQQPPITTYSGMNLGVPYPRDRSIAARANCIAVMRRHL
ncbi:hypothetical protein [Streptomyces sp. WG7]|uniref:hypothetical protein n=1 Tax=Streptomyces sp. WG7 TaxID=3417650 RepID=UPI003CF800E8